MSVRRLFVMSATISRTLLEISNVPPSPLPLGDVGAAFFCGAGRGFENYDRVSSPLPPLRGTLSLRERDLLHRVQRSVIVERDPQHAGRILSPPSRRPRLPRNHSGCRNPQKVCFSLRECTSQRRSRLL